MFLAGFWWFSSLRSRDKLWRGLLILAILGIVAHYVLLGGIPLSWPLIILLGAVLLAPRSRYFWRLVIFLAGYALVIAIDPSSGLPLSGWITNDVFSGWTASKLAFGALGVIFLGCAGLWAYTQHWSHSLLIPIGIGLLFWAHANIFNAFTYLQGFLGSSGVGVLLILGAALYGLRHMVSGLHPKGRPRGPRALRR